MNKTPDVPVLIVGAGPVGLLTALSLSRHGIPSYLVDKRQTALTAPKAHAVNPRTLEICESLGLSAAGLRALGASANEGGKVRFMGTLSGPEFGALPYERQDEAAFADTPFPLSNIPQPVFEQELIKAVHTDTNVTFCRGIECTALIDKGAQVQATLFDNQANTSASAGFDYVVAADGAGSLIRQALDITMEGPEALQDFLMIHFSADLRPVTEDRRGVLYFLFKPGVRGTLIAYDQSQTWVLMHPWNRATETLEDYDHERCRLLVMQAVGQPVDDVVIENISPWQMTAQIAQRYSKGRVFLAGDAAHRFPPAGGLGLNTGAGDAQNLSWKLAAVLNGEAGAALLDTYAEERQHIARTNSEQSLTNAAKIFELFAAIQGTDASKAEERYAAVAANPTAFPELTAAVEAQKPHFDSFGLQLGYRYNSGAIVAPETATAITDVSDYQPSWAAGAHFPHRWVVSNGQTAPLQDLLPMHQFSMLYGPQAERVAVAGVNHLQLGADFEFAGGEGWAELTGLAESGSLLIRPDGHIAARFPHAETTEVASVMNTILFREV